MRARERAELVSDVVHSAITIAQRREVVKTWRMDSGVDMISMNEIRLNGKVQACLYNRIGEESLRSMWSPSILRPSVATFLIFDVTEAPKPPFITQKLLFALLSSTVLFTRCHTSKGFFTCPCLY